MWRGIRFLELRTSAVVAGCVGLLAAALPVQARAQQQCPNPAPVTIAPQSPSEVCVPSGFRGNPIAFFDDFSWRSFIAMVWPVQPGMRGVPDQSKSIGPVSGPLVFETYKNDWEIFQPSLGDNQPPPAPSAWNSYAGANPCTTSGAPITVNFGDVVLSSFSHFGNMGEAGQPPGPPLVGPLPAQNGTYTRYFTAYNQLEFNQIAAQKLYLRANLPMSDVGFSAGSIDVKAAWMDMSGVKNPQRYYTRTAYLMDPFANPITCRQVTVGLVGLHIVQKTPSRPQWVWSTFEQIDNVPGGASQGPFAYHNGDAAQPMPASNPNGWPPQPTPSVFNVQRLIPINPSTVTTNRLYQSALQAKGVPWQFYQLVMTQWPLQPHPPNPIPRSQQGTPGNTFPPATPASAFANVVLETFDQRRIQTGCMNCHTGTQTNTDFLWSLGVNAWPPLVTSPATPLLTMLSAQQRMSATSATRQQTLAASQVPASFAYLVDLLKGARQP